MATLDSFIPILEVTVAVFLMAMSLVFHELGHWVMLKRYNVPVVEVGIGLGPKVYSMGICTLSLFPIGGFVRPEPVGYSGLSENRKMMIALMGPIFSCLYGLMLYSGVYFAEGNVRGLVLLANFNMLLGLFNLIPVPPFDGWHVCKGFYKQRGITFNARTEQVLGVYVVYSLGFAMLLGMFF